MFNGLVLELWLLPYLERLRPPYSSCGMLACVNCTRGGGYVNMWWHVEQFSLWWPKRDVYSNIQLAMHRRQRRYNSTEQLQQEQRRICFVNICCFRAACEYCIWWKARGVVCHVIPCAMFTHQDRGHHIPKRQPTHSTVVVKCCF